MMTSLEAFLKMKVSSKYEYKINASMNLTESYRNNFSVYFGGNS